ncbi:uncharacterized protein PAC_13359 [Phialocephala subalpina]|uniref:Uncharacterized protein n=1 Tax=Phialocephala subalpina TaxID=576137 RepID=A0A1L7XEK5_9HELO|nr:uncharacterized protein PAC_13359 [Phialocephala subalpina]
MEATAHSHTASPGPTNPVNPAPSGKQLQHVPATDYAPLYRSIYTIQTSIDCPDLLKRLAHVNCGYLSTRGIAPNLLTLKQHAQALTILIKNVTVSTLPALIDNVNSHIHGAAKFNDGETYDWLNDLNHLYTGPQNPNYIRHHKMPLTALMNITETGNDPNGGGHHDQPAHMLLDDICPLHYAMKSPEDGKSMPYAQHQTLIDHANEILEILDHEYSAKGGLLSILPDKNSTNPEEKAQWEKSQTTLLGQMILHIQRLVMRVHDLERCYSNALDALANEAVVPSQALTKMGPDGRKGREIVYPQDRFVLANCGEDLWDFLNYEFEKKEASDEAVRLMYKKSGVIGQDMWRVRGQKEYERGITVLDISTRYIRLRKDPLKTVFVIPAHEHHPGVKATKDMEKVPTVVSVVKPVWPERVSAWEMKNRAQLEELKQLRQDYQIAVHEKTVAQNAEKMMTTSEIQHRLAMNTLKEQLKNCNEAKKPGETEAVKKANAERDAAKKENDRLQAEKDQLVTEKKTLEDEKKRITAEDAALEQQKLHFRTARDKIQKDHDERLAASLEAVRQTEQQDAMDAAELHQKLKAAWQKQIQDTGAVLSILQLRKVNLDERIAGEKEAEEAGKKVGSDEFNKEVNEYMAKKGVERAAKRAAQEVKNKKGKKKATVEEDDEQMGFGYSAESDMESDMEMYD